MAIRASDAAKPFETPSGEIIDEIFGAVAKGTSSHSLASILLPPGKQSELHYHPICEEVYYMLEGNAEIIFWPINSNLDKDFVIKNIKSGDAVAIPNKYWHQIKNKSSKNVKFLATCSPSWTPDCSVYYNIKQHGSLHQLSPSYATIIQRTNQSPQKRIENLIKTHIFFINFFYFVNSI